MKSKLLLCLSITLFFTQLLSAQTWSTLGTAQFANNPKQIATTVDETTGNLYVAYVDQSDNDHLKVKFYDGTTWNDLGGTVSAIGNVSIPSININPATGEPWVVYRTDITASSNILVVKRFNGSNWLDEGTNISGSSGGNPIIPAYRSFINFDDSGNAYIAYSSFYTNLFYRTFVRSNKTGSWQTEFNVQHTELSAFDYPSYNLFYYTSMNNGNLGIFKKTLDTNVSWSSATSVYSNSNFPPGGFQNAGTFPGLAANTLNENFLVKRNSTNGPIFYTGDNPNELLDSPPNSDDARGRTMQMKFNPIDGNTYALYVNDLFEVKISKFDGSTWTDLAPMPQLNNATLNQTATLNIRNSDGRIFVSNVDFSSPTVLGLTSYYQDVTPAVTKFYVDQNATGSNDGTSWANAYTSLHDGLDAIENDIIADTLWVAQGTYKPDNSSRSESFRILGDNNKVFGGFNGTETDLDQRDIEAHPTIISGDLAGNDDPNDFTYSSVFRLDNSRRLVSVGADNVELNGFILKDGHADGSSSPANRGAAINKFDQFINFTLKNCIVKDNISNVLGAVYLRYNNSSDLNIESCEFTNNFSRYGSGFSAVVTTANKVVDVSVNNCLFHGNVSGDVNAGDGLSASSFGLLLNNGATINATITNNTFSNNYDVSTASSIDKGTVALRRFVSSDVLNVEFHNNIFWNNYSDDNGTINPQNIGLMNGSQPITSLNFTHNNYNQTNLASKASTFTESNNLNTDPLFVDEANFDFSLQASSPMIDAGDNSQIPSGITEDILGNNRIQNTSVDLGAFEFDGPLPDLTAPNVVTQDITVQLDANGQVSIQASDVDDGSTDDQTSTADLILSLDQTTFDCSNIGQNTVTLTVEDEAENTATDTAIVTVEDNTAPNAITQDITVQLDANGQASIQASDIDDGSSDNCTISNLSLSDSNFDCSNIGQNTVSLLLEDDSGNQTITTAIVTVEDNTAPNAITQDITIQLDANGQASIQASDIDDGSSDNCTISNLSLSDSDFDCSNIGQNTVSLLLEDASGNQTITTAIVTVEDTSGPSLTTLDVTVDLAGNSSVSITETQVLDNVSDNCSAVSDISLSLDQDTFTSIGTYTVNLTATDLEGNQTTVVAVVTVEDTLSNVNFEFTNSIKIYPNPASSSFQISTENEIKLVEIYDSLGRKLIRNQNKQIDVSQLTKGIYMVKITSLENYLATKQLIVK
ncbi:T9SS type A sorting domain-containing protein [Psychroflexus planctonicus]|uniref:Secretion system C-terminal sorting domain-containing protein n=1 Tax=Psychroflexus planctonicus TaxID=1526575 RepID=A0ABQ1SF39_9FLAO|nr:T9SS type A sorting domain-containing protein [Psychroflexus planctonicus]GGE32931.1 hypothetical protein GCM10010832_11440 [Psychroflexus planctonicus]